MPGVRPGVAGVRDPGNVVNAFKLLMRREQNVSRMGRFTKSECCHIARHYLPSKSRIVDQMHSKAYIGQFNKQGDTFIGCFQNKSIRLYDTETDFKLRKEVQARGLRWTITDTSLSPDQRWLVYSSITPIVHMVNMASSGATSIANVTDIHETLDFGPDQCGLYGRQGIWSLEFSHDGREIAAGMGAGDPALCLLDMDTGKVTVRVRGHRDDVNAVRYADASSNILFTGSDDRMCKVWDRRILGSTSGAPVGVLLGHTEGITHIDSKGDGLHLISNGKDQAVRLWDIRKMLNPSEAREALQRWHFPQFHWDYRCMDYPGVGLAIRHPRDCSVQAYRGHRVLETLIRCYFSPMHTTGQRYIYTGSHEGSVHMYDVVTGKEMRKLDAHISTVRDMSWHPTLPLLVSVSWDGTIRRWDHQR
uniref:DDB1- and CUL4-associated factor 11 n=1 Tax=Pyramimonas obovata TaxID=1411642 RepID=A0A7S0N7W5_9CHLO